MQGGHGETALFTAMQSKNAAQIVKALLQGGTDPNAQAADGIAALHQAATFAGPDVVESLLQGGAYPNARTNKGMTALSFALAKGDSESAALLRSMGAEL